jgi:hypothetical protein
MEKLRQEDLSLHHYLRHFVLSEYIETDTSVPLVYLDDVSDPASSSYVYQASTTLEPSPTSRGRGWVYTDVSPYITEQTSSVIVYDGNGAVISGSEYMVDYIDGRVVTSGTVTPATVTYDWYYVALVNDWADAIVSDVPVVVIELADFAKSGFLLGGGRVVRRRGRFHIFASSTAERDDLAELLYDSIYNKCVNFQTFETGTMIDWDGTYHELYTYATVDESSHLQFENVRSRIITIPLIPDRRTLVSLSDINRYRNRIDFTMFHYEEA